MYQSPSISFRMPLPHVCTTAGYVIALNVCLLNVCFL